MAVVSTTVGTAGLPPQARRPGAGQGAARVRRGTAALAGLLLLVPAAAGSAAVGPAGSGGAAGQPAAAPGAARPTPEPPSPPAAGARPRPPPVRRRPRPGSAGRSPARCGDPRLGARVSATVAGRGDRRGAARPGRRDLRDPRLDREADHRGGTAGGRRRRTGGCPTRVVAGARPGEVVLVGGGDPTLSARRTGRAVDVRGGAADRRPWPRRRGGPASARSTRVVVDGSLFTGPRLGPGWDPADVTGGYVAPITALTAGRRPAGAGRRDRFAEPDLAAGRALAAALGAPTAPVVRGRAAPGARTARRGAVAAARPAGGADAAGVRQRARRDTRPAGRAGASGGRRASPARPRRCARCSAGSGCRPAATGWSTAAACRCGTGSTPALLAAVLRAVAGPDQPELHALVPGLPVVRVRRHARRPVPGRPGRAAAGQVRAKTGTLTGVSSLAGLVRGVDGRLLAFAVVADRVSPTGTLARRGRARRRRRRPRPLRLPLTRRRRPNRRRGVP